MGLVISKRRRPDSPFASSQCHSVVLQPRLPVSPPLLSASTHTRSTLQGFRSRIAPQTALSLRPSLSLASLAKPRDCTLHHCTVGPLASRYRRRSSSSATPSSSRKAARRQTELFCAPLPPTRFIARRPRMGTGHRVAGRFFSRTDRGEGMFVRSSRQQRTTIVVQFEGGGSKLSGVKKRCVDKGKRKRGV